MKTKLLYIVSGFLAMTILCVMIAAPTLYFQRDNWQEETENVIIDSQTQDVSIPEKLRMLYCTTMTNGDSPLQEPYRYSKTFIPSGKELPKEKLGEVMGWEFSKISSMFCVERDRDHPSYYYIPDYYIPDVYDSQYSHLYVSYISSLLTHFPEEAITDASMCQIVSLEESTRGFVVWQVDFKTKLEKEGVTITGHVDMDAVSGTFLYWNLTMTFDEEYPAYAPFDSAYDMDVYYEDMMKSYYNFVRTYWKLDVQNQDTVYSMGAGWWECNDYGTSKLTATMTMQKTEYLDDNFGAYQTGYSWRSVAYPIEDYEQNS